jgi:WD40 repeat protein
LTIAAVGASVIAVQQRKIAETQRARAVEQSRLAQARQLAAQSRAILAQSPEQLPLAALLALESTRMVSTTEGNESLRAAQPGGAETVEFSPDGSVVASGAVNGAVEIWKLDRADQVTTLTQADSVNAVSAAANGMLASSSAGMVEVWSPTHVSPSQTVKLPVGRVDAPTACWRPTRSCAVKSFPLRQSVPPRPQARALTRRARISWARLLERVFDVDVEHCPNCGGVLKIIAAPSTSSGQASKIRR